jgi:5-formyltetrahydrofolate cyclo-ligase
MILLPLLAFDEKGYRVGYGKGFYDRYLSRCRLDILKVGLSMEAPMAEIGDTDAYDMRMDYCVTPEKVWEFV